MRIFVAAITFGITIGGLFLFENYKTAPREENYAQIVQGLAPNETARARSAPLSRTGLANQTQTKTPTPKPVNKSSKIVTKAPTSSPTISFATTPTSSLPSASPTPLPTPTPTPTFTPTVTFSPTPFPTTTTVPTESSIQPTPTPSTGHIFYTSSYATAKYYYCDTDSGWKTLSTKYLKSFSSPEELLKAYPTRILHEPCE